MNFITLSRKPSDQLNEFELGNNQLVLINNNVTCKCIKTIFLVHNLCGKFIYLYDINGIRRISIEIPNTTDIIYYNFSNNNKLLSLNYSL